MAKPVEHSTETERYLVYWRRLNELMREIQQKYHDKIIYVSSTSEWKEGVAKLKAELKLE